MRLLRYEIMRLFGYDIMRPYTRIHDKQYYTWERVTGIHEKVMVESPLFRSWYVL